MNDSLADLRAALSSLSRIPTHVPSASLAGSSAGTASTFGPAAPAAGLTVKSRSSTWTLPPPNGFWTVKLAVKSSASAALESGRDGGVAGGLPAAGELPLRAAVAGVDTGLVGGDAAGLTGGVAPGRTG